MVKQILKSLRTKILYPKHQIAFSSHVMGSTYLAKNTKIGKQCSVYNSILLDTVLIDDFCYIFNSKLENNTNISHHSSLFDVSLGRFSYVAHHSLLNLIQVGSFCSIGPYLLSGTGDHPTNFVSTSPLFFSTLHPCGISFSQKNFFEERKKTIIGHDVWIGSRVFIRDGIKIGNGAIIAAGAVVVKDVPHYAIVGGVPAKVIRFRFSEKIIEELCRIQWWNWSEEKLRQAQTYFVKKDISSLIKWANDENVQKKSFNYNLSIKENCSNF